MPKMSTMVSPEVFNYSAFQRDLFMKIKDSGETMTEISVRRLFKSENYLSNALGMKRLPHQMIISLAEWYGLNLRDYKIEKAVEKPAVKPVEVTEPYSCEVKVDEEFGTVMMRVLKDGKMIATGRSFLYGTDTVGIMQSISYAAHMCYKIAQQGAISEVGEPKQVERVVFKDWVKKYETANSTYGSFARYVASHYQKFPTTGEKQMRYYLQLNNGQTHLTVFATLFKMYLAWHKEVHE